MTKCKRWLYNKFLPAWCKDGLMAANARLEAVAEAQAREICRLNAYIDGMERALGLQRRPVGRGEARGG